MHSVTSLGKPVFVWREAEDIATNWGFSSYRPKEQRHNADQDEDPPHPARGSKKIRIPLSNDDRLRNPITNELGKPHFVDLSLSAGEEE